ncbi:MAG: beta-lactamase family protein [Clostridiales bacterium]|jgi:CubicO group peptidase (beta-lactamase class C family)|nr:beta-lactamase family protein [Clostridiales bacterium]
MNKFENFWNEWNESKNFSGVVSVSGEHGGIFQKSCGYRNRGEQLLNNESTAFSIASGTKFFTGLAVCKLIDEKKLKLEDKLCDLVKFDVGQIDKRVTVFHLLTHTSGVGDYIDEESDDSLEQLSALYSKYPVYLWERLEYYLPMITVLPPKFEPGKRYGYSNSGFILLGLVIEAVSGISYQQFVRETIIVPAKLERTGFYRADSLPANTAHGYMYNEETGEWRTNIFSLPVLGGSDGGIYICANDFDKLWRALFSNIILSESMTQEFLKPHSCTYDAETYGLGVYRCELNGKLFYYAVGGDFGVDFFTAYLPEQKITISALGNTEINTYPLMEKIISLF